MSAFTQSSCPALSPQVPDLTVFTEATRRALYDLVAGIAFAPPPDDDPTEAPTLPDDPDRAALLVFHAFERWFAVWSLPAAEAATLPPCRRREMVRIQADPEAAGGVMLYEI
jgi:hypothetical protein